MIVLSITARKLSLGQGNIFTLVCHSVHRWGGIPACIAGGIPACLAVGGVLSQHILQVVSLHALQQGGVLSQHALQQGGLLQGDAWSGGGEVCPRGVPGPGGSTPGGSAPGGWCLVETPQMATAAGGTHPTGMHSCFSCIDYHLV